MATPKSNELRERLSVALRPPKNKKLTIEESAAEMKAVRLKCRELGIDYSKLLIEVCQSLSIGRKKE